MTSTRRRMTVFFCPVGEPRSFAIIARRRDAWVQYPEEPVGSVVLELDGVEPRPELRPDLAGLYVLPQHRHRGRSLPFRGLFGR